MVEYVFDTTQGTFKFFTDSERFFIREPVLDEIYEHCFDLTLVYLKERDDTFAKSLIKAYYDDSLKKVADIINKLKKVKEAEELKLG